RRLVVTTAAYGVGALVWFVPLVVVSGGPRAYLRVFYSQGAEDLSGVAMLATRPTPRQFILALQYAFVAPWSEWVLAAAVLIVAAVGVVRLLRTASWPLVVLVVAFGPYLVFD